MRAAALIPLTIAALARFAPVALASDGDFRRWYPEYSSVFQQILATSCQEEFEAWRTDNRTIVGSPLHENDGARTPGETVVQCVLSSTSEFIKANMASAAVLLGTMPFALSVLGSTTEESALLLVIARRPLLTTLLLAGAPVVVALRPFEWKDPVDILRAREGRFQSLRLGPPWFVLALEYLLVLACVANVAHATYELGVGVVTMILPGAQYLPGLWAITGILVHFIGALCLQSRLRVVSRHRPNGESILRSEFTLSAHKDITVETMDERKTFLILSWITSTSTTFHVIFGTLAFSSMQFISVRDAFGVIGRYTASVTVTRIVLMYELSGLRSSVKTVEEVSQSVAEAAPNEAGVKRPSRIFTFSP